MPWRLSPPSVYTLAVTGEIWGRQRLLVSFRTPGAPNRPLYSPVPESNTNCGLSRALSVITTFADSEPVTEGVNVTAIVHEEPAGSVAAGESGQVLDSGKSAEFLPAVVMLKIVRGVAPVFLSVTALTVLEPTGCLPKLKPIGFSHA